MKDDIKIRNYKNSDELEWLDLHASVMVDSYAWWIVIHKKPNYKKETIDLVACHNERIIGFTTGEVNSEMSKSNEVFIWEFGVHRNYRGKNIGRIMIKNLHKIMNENYGLNKSIWYSQDPASIEYYKHIGMKEIGRHWQLSLVPTKEQKDAFKKDNFYCRNIRGACDIDKLDEVRKIFTTDDDDDTLKPMICVGFEYVK
ncbi:MAG: GNAT family N-acetyltransferase [Ignavibacteria bacterium]|nr:GNAT family N-acetyltransferase [Ignavibacteria bacterium]